MHSIGGALANEAAVDVHEGVHDVLLMCSMCTVHGDVHGALHDDVRDHAKWCTGLRFFTLVRN